MAERRPDLLAPLGVLAASVAAACLAGVYAPSPSADVSVGTEEAFARGLHWRELPPRRPPLRWTTERATFTFTGLAPDSAELVVAARAHRHAVAVVAGGRHVGSLSPGTREARYVLAAPLPETLLVELRAVAFVAGDGRRLGTQLDRVSLEQVPRPRPPGRILAALVTVGLVTWGLARASGWTPWPAAAAAGANLALLLAAAWKGGAVRSPYLAGLAALIVVATAAAALFARLLERRAGAGRLAFGALLAATAVQLVVPTSPVTILSDVAFHANKLLQVAGGDLFPTSVTQHARVFRFPYGVTFYALLAPLVRGLGVDPVAAVRWGAAVAGWAASAVLFALLARRGAPLAASAVVALQLLPLTTDVYSFGNLSNAFGQSLTVAAFAWWVAGRPGGAALGALLLTATALAHFSCLVVLAALVAGLVAADLPRLRASRTHQVALACAAALAVAYYSRFVPLVVEQLPRLMEGGGQGRGASLGAAGALRAQVETLLRGWGWPAMVLAWFGRPRRAADPLDRSLVGFWAGVGALFVPAMLSPLDVRYLYALTAPLAVAAGAGFLALSGRGGAGRAAAVGLAALQAFLAAANLVDVVARRYTAAGDIL